ncbi:hypothetical protein JTE90_026616 [Oedothorax gibbosus]|uniref:Uncharacterized protein n=1 Tax=Oedothorax gibbosus TaxID=931172 RepID=A0AAV6V0R2_9ARAC|nr:hypothetical protein JTE90_026616 [Oedothorax gibbosus]
MSIETLKERGPIRHPFRSHLCHPLGPQGFYGAPVGALSQSFPPFLRIPGLAPLNPFSKRDIAPCKFKHS